MHCIINISSITDTYEGMGRWPDDGNVDLWNYPKNCSELKVTYVFAFLT